jgi:hypothetical protein
MGNTGVPTKKKIPRTGWQENMIFLKIIVNWFVRVDAVNIFIGYTTVIVGTASGTNDVFDYP